MPRKKPRKGPPPTPKNPKPVAPPANPETWSPTEVTSAIMSTHHVASDMVSRVHRTQSKLMLVLVEAQGKGDLKKIEAGVIEVLDILGLPPETWE